MSDLGASGFGVRLAKKEASSRLQRALKGLEFFA